MSNAETKLQYAIQEALCWLPGCEAWRCNTGKRGGVRFGLQNLKKKTAGTPDLIGIVDGVFLGVEVKMPGEWPNEDQEARLEQIRKLGGIAIVGRDVKEVIKTVQLRQRQLRKERQLLHCLSLATEDMGELANAAENIVLRRALKAALNTWCPSDPGGDGADGETYRLCCEALGLGER
jgi:hypothetical protein